MANLPLVRRHCFWDGFLTVQSPLQVLFNFCDHYPISRAVKRCIAGAEAAHAGFLASSLRNLGSAFAKRWIWSFPRCWMRQRRSGSWRRSGLRVVFEQGSTLVPVNGGRLKPAHLLVAMIEQWDPAVSSAVTKLGFVAEEVLRDLSGRLIERQKTPRQKTKIRRRARSDGVGTLWPDLTDMAAKGCLPPLIGRREEMLKITRILLQSRKNNLILIGEPRW